MDLANLDPSKPYAMPGMAAYRIKTDKVASGWYMLGAYDAANARRMACVDLRGGAYDGELQVWDGERYVPVG